VIAPLEEGGELLDVTGQVTGAGESTVVTFSTNLGEAGRAPVLLRCNAGTLAA
jgi:hypothetical protein